MLCPPPTELPSFHYKPHLTLQILCRPSILLYQSYHPATLHYIALHIMKSMKRLLSLILYWSILLVDTKLCCCSRSSLQSCPTQAVSIPRMSVSTKHPAFCEPHTSNNACFVWFFAHGLGKKGAWTWNPAAISLQIFFPSYEVHRVSW